jgi:outer membrane receptor for ferrienterochelin and colicin
MESNEQLYNRVSVQADLNLLTSSLVLKAPITDQIALIFSGRTTYQDAASNPIFDAFENDLNLATDAGTTGFTRPDLVETVPSFRFFDLNAKLKWQLSPKSKLDLNFFHSNDDLINEYENTFQVRVAANRTAENGEFFSNSEQWENLGSSLNYQLEMSKQWQWSSSFYFTQYQNDGLIQSSLTRDFRDREIELFSFQNDQYNRITDLGWRNQLDKKLSNNRTLTLGSEFIQHDNEFQLREEDRITFGGISQTYELALFGAVPIVNTPDFHLDLGARATYYGRTDQLYWSPRLNLFYRLKPGFALKGSATQANQFVREIVHENRLGQSMDFFLLSNGEEYPVGTSNQFMLGTNVQLGAFNLDVELYHKDHEGLIEHGRLFAGFDQTEVNPGRQRAYKVFNGKGTTQGMDLLLKYEKSTYQGWLSYTLSKTEHQFKEIYRNEPFPSEDDRRHQFSWVNNYELGKFSLSANYIFATGRPFSNLAFLEQPSDVRVIDPKMFFDRLPNYSRLDLGLSYNFNWKWTDCSLGISMFNVTNHANVKYQQFIYSLSFLQEGKNGAAPKEASKVIGATTRMLDRTLNLNFNVRF